jgi:hypothetical protein
MSDQNAPIQPPADGLPDQVAPELEAAVLDALKVNTQKCAGAADARDAADYARAVLALSQAAVILDPKLVAPQGVPADALNPPKPLIPMDKNAPSGRKVVGR